jgi:hypothetical protein
MSDMDLESPDVDAAEQNAAATPEAATQEEGEPEEPSAGFEPPLEADPADADEQARILEVDDDEYR